MEKLSPSAQALSSQELKWIDKEIQDLEVTNYAIQELSDLLITIAETGKKCTNEKFNEGIGREGVMSIANAIKSLTEKIDFHNFTIGQTVHGFTAAEFRGRQQHAKKKPLMQ